ncbi:MAG: mechanosensitive ion channel [Pseudomonadales bacterium]|nr:mechanosensitive ion channel [Pseudomonadales bacterium]
MATLQQYPEIAALLVLILGLVLGKVAERGVRHALALVERLASRTGSRHGGLFSPAFQRASGLLAYGIVLALAITEAIRLLGISQLTSWLDQALAYAPRVVIALFILGIGNALGVLARNLVAGVAGHGTPDALGPRAVQAAILVVAIITALQQLGIDISFITQLAMIVLAAVVGGLSLAFALGARRYVANLLAQTELARYGTGERLRIDQDEGLVVEIHRTGLVLATPEGLVSIPAARLAEGRVVRLPVDLAED